MRDTPRSITLLSCGYVVTGASRSSASNVFATIEFERTAADLALRFLDEPEGSGYRQIGRFLIHHTDERPAMEEGAIEFHAIPPSLHASSRFEGTVRRRGSRLEWGVNVGRQPYAGPLLSRATLLLVRLVFAQREDAGALFRGLCGADPRAAAALLNTKSESSPFYGITALLGPDDLAHAMTSEERALREAAILALSAEGRVGCSIQDRSPDGGIRR